jgi:hypothetical protein
VCDRCEPALDRRRFLRALAAGGAVAATTGWWTPDAAANPLFESGPAGEERLPIGLAAPEVAPFGVGIAEAVRTVAPPRIVTRKEWGADESIRTSGRAFCPIRKLIVHHTASANDPSDPAAIVRAIYRMHVVDRGYADIGYNFVIDQHGTVYEGRWARNYAPGEIHDGEDGHGRGVMGAHALGANAGSCGIVLIGNFMSSYPTKAALYSLIRLLAWKAARHRIDAWKAEAYVGLFRSRRRFPNIAGHRNVGLTGCPGNGVLARMSTIRGSVAWLAGSYPNAVVDMGAAIRYRNGMSPITLSTPTGNDVRPGHGTTTAKTPTSQTTGERTTGRTSATSSSGGLLGVRVLSMNGGLVSLGLMERYGSPAARGAADVIAITAGPRQSFWALGQSGRVLAFGATRVLGSLIGKGERSPAVDLAANRAGTGYWILTRAGGVWAFGTASWMGSPAHSGTGVKGVRIHATPSGNGYWILARNGGMYAYGDASWYGSARHSGVAGAMDFWPTPTGRGYWVVTWGGAVLSYGDAVGYGDMRVYGSWARPAVGVLGVPTGRGYYVLAADGGVYNFGHTAFFGSLAGSGRRALGIAPALL